MFTRKIDVVVSYKVDEKTNYVDVSTDPVTLHRDKEYVRAFPQGAVPCATDDDLADTDKLSDLVNTINGKYGEVSSDTTGERTKVSAFVWALNQGVDLLERRLVAAKYLPKGQTTAKCDATLFWVGQESANGRTTHMQSLIGKTGKARTEALLAIFDENREAIETFVGKTF